MSISTHTKDLQLHARQTSDSRGRPTVEVEARLGGATAVGDVPAGASKGEDEAQTVDVQTALDNVHNVILPLAQKANLDLRDHANLAKLEEEIIARAGDNFKDLGANATLPVSRALWRLAAALHNQPLHAYLRKAEPTLASNNRVHFLMNIFNGGLHALKKKDGEVLGKDRIDIQEIMVVPTSAKTYREAVQVGERIDAALKDILTTKFGAAAVTRADEAGFSVKGLGDSTEAIAHVFDAIKRAGYTPGTDVKLALDVAASSFYDAETQRYQFQGKAITSDAMIDYLVAFADRYKGNVLSIEDGLAENDWEAWKKLSAKLKERGVVTVGDDLFVTQFPRLKKGIAEKSAHAILIKVNQNGTVHGTLQVMKLAEQNGMECIISHRSGETLDDSIADIAYATGALGLKTGDPQPEVDFPDKKTWVRRSKYLRMIAIEEGK
ncbi:MAG TPA: phosphopyruvate hydratase [Myxococcota bacterium]|nr:phosphopyruvate hydratase [Myxococcota bacterium]